MQATLHLPPPEGPRLIYVPADDPPVTIEIPTAGGRLVLRQAWKREGPGGERLSLHYE